MALLSKEDSQRGRTAEKIQMYLNPLDVWLKLPDLVELSVNPDGKIWVEVFGKPPVFQNMTYNPHDSMSLISRLASYWQKEIGESNPMLNCEVPFLDGRRARFSATIPPAVTQPCMSIRMHQRSVLTIDDYVKEGILTASEADKLSEHLISRSNIIVSGATGSGKTTLLNALLNRAVQSRPHDRWIILEDTPEINCQAENSVIMQTSKDVSFTDLIRQSLRMKPDRIAMGEVRDGAAALDLLKAWNTGHPGGLCTIHSGSAHNALARIRSLLKEVVASDNAALGEEIAMSVDLVVQINRADGKLCITDIASVDAYNSEDDSFDINTELV